MFDRNVKLHFNKMKYQNLTEKHYHIYNPSINFKEVHRGRYFMLYLGITAGFSFYNFDVVRYKFTRGLVRWKNRVVNLFKSNDHHSHDHHSKDHKEDHNHQEKHHEHKDKDEHH